MAPASRPSNEMNAFEADSPGPARRRHRGGRRALGRHVLQPSRRGDVRLARRGGDWTRGRGLARDRRRRGAHADRRLRGGGRAWPAAWRSADGPADHGPGGAAALGRLFNVLGEPLDGGPPLDGCETWPIHRARPAAGQPAARVGVPGDRDQGHRPAGAAAARRQGRADRRRRRRQDGPAPGIHPDAQPRARAASPSSPASASGPARATTCGWRCRRPASSPTPSWSSAR